MFRPYASNATLLALSAAVLSGFANFVSKIGVTIVHDPVAFTTLKNGLVALLLISVLLLARKTPELRALSARQWTWLGVIGLIGGALPFGLFFTGLSMVSAINGALIHKTLVFWVIMLGAFFLKEKLTLPQLAGVALLFVSNLVVGGFSGFTYGTGEFLILTATILWAVETILARKILASVSSIVVASARMMFGSLLLLAFLTITGGIGSLTGMTSTAWVWTFAVSGLLFGYILAWYHALARAPAPYVAALLVPATLITNVLSALFITRSLTYPQVLSIILVVLGTALVVLFTGRTTRTLAHADTPSMSATG